MTVQPNGTDAKDIAMYFVKVAMEKATSQEFKRTVGQAKSLLASGYTKDEIIKSIDYILDVKKVKMYSLGYMSYVIGKTLVEIKQLEEKGKQEEYMSQQREVTSGDECATERNRLKAERIGANIQSRIGKKYHFDLFEES